MKNKFKDELKKLSNRIYRSWHSRVKMSNRILKMSKTLEILYEYYTVSLTILSVYSLVVKDYYAGYLSAVLSIVAMGLAFCGNNMNLKERYKNVTNNYIKLDRLYYKTIITKTCTKEEFEKIYNEYIDILNECENHGTIDFISASLEDKENRTGITLKQKMFLYAYIFFKSIFLFFLFVIPTGVIFYSIINYFLLTT